MWASWLTQSGLIIRGSASTRFSGAIILFFWSVIGLVAVKLMACSLVMFNVFVGWFVYLVGFFVLCFVFVFLVCCLLLWLVVVPLKVALLLSISLLFLLFLICSFYPPRFLKRFILKTVIVNFYINILFEEFRVF